MNPLTNVKNIQKLNQRELELGIGSKTSWHQQYKDSAWIFIGGLPYDLTEGDLLAVFSQYGELVNINLVRDKASGKSKGFAFLCFEDQRSTILTVDNLNGIKVLGRTLRVDHVENYRQPKETGEEDEMTQMMRAEGCAPKTPSHSEGEEKVSPQRKEKDAHKKKKKQKKEKKKKTKTKKEESSASESDTDPPHQSRRKQPKLSPDRSEPIKIKEEKIDPKYAKYSVKMESQNVREMTYRRHRGEVKSEVTEQDRKSETGRDSSRERMRDPYGKDRDRFSSSREQTGDRDRRREESYRPNKGYDRPGGDRARERDGQDRERRRDK